MLLLLEYDYSDTDYPIPFKELYQNKNSRYEGFNKPIDSLNPKVLTGEVPSFLYQTSDVLMMTGATANHAFASFNCFYSMVLADPYASYVYLDLGIDNMQRRKLFYHFDTVIQMQQKMLSTGVIAYRRLNWAAFPDWMTIDHNPLQTGGYSWKVVALVDIFYEWRAVIYWLDAGCVIREGITRELTVTRHCGLYSPYSSGNVGQWVHNYTHLYMIENKLLSHWIDFNTPMISGGVLMMDYSNSTIRNRLVPAYIQCAYTRKCISPRETNRTNHRQDQAVLTLLTAQYRIPLRHLIYSPVIQADTGYNETASGVILNNLLLKIQDMYSIRLSNAVRNSTLRYSPENYKSKSRPLDDSWPIHSAHCCNKQGYRTTNNNPLAFHEHHHKATYKHSSF